MDYKISIKGCEGCESELREALNMKKIYPSDHVFIELGTKHISLAIINKFGKTIVDNRAFKKIKNGYNTIHK